MEILEARKAGRATVLFRDKSDMSLLQIGLLPHVSRSERKDWYATPSRPGYEGGSAMTSMTVDVSVLEHIRDQLGECVQVVSEQSISISPRSSLEAIGLMRSAINEIDAFLNPAEIVPITATSTV